MLHIIKLALKGFSPSPLGMRLAGGRDFIVRRMCLRAETPDRFCEISVL
jgi:hypothetical protein